MPIVDRFIPDDTKCRCGRDLKYIHCTNCGSANVVGLVKDRNGYKQTQSEFERDGRWWSCRRCKRKFCDRERIQECDAQAIGLSMKAQRAADTIQENVSKLFDSEEERMKVLNNLFGKKKQGDKQ